MAKAVRKRAVRRLELRVDAELFAAVEALAVESGVSVNETVSALVRLVLSESPVLEVVPSLIVVRKKRKGE